MSKELIAARSKLNQVKSHLKQQKLMPAVLAVHDALITVLKSSLMKAEKDEFNRLLDQAVHALDTDPELRKEFPLKLAFTPGQERELLETLKDLLDGLQQNTAAMAMSVMEEMARQKEQKIAKGQEHLDKQEYDEAKDTFSELVGEHSDDTSLKADIGERYLKAGRYEEAIVYLNEALKDDPNMLYLYNRVGIALRKLGKFEIAEKYYVRALKIGRGEANLWFNIGRLYIDWGKWDKVAEAARKALERKPDFSEARKMLVFAEKKL